MGSVDRKVAWICAGFIALAALLAILYFANEWWLSGVVTASLVCWLAGVLAAVYARPGRRPVLVCALAASFLYVLLALGPWFRTNVGPWLLTTRGLAALERQVFGGTQQAEAAYQVLPYINPFPPVNIGIVGSGVMDGSVFNQPSFITPITTPSTRVMLGHWLCGWIAAAVGGGAAWWIVRRRQRSDAEEQPAAQFSEGTIEEAA
jgi:hypothetical protein